MFNHRRDTSGAGLPPPRWWQVAAWQVLGALLLLSALIAGWGLMSADTRVGVEQRVLGWLQMRHEARADGGPAPEASLSPLAALAAPRKAQPSTAPLSAPTGTAAAPRGTAEPTLSGQQEAVARWISLRYRVASEPIARIVHEAWETGRKAGLDPLLILAVMAVESRFNPFSQSPMGAEGLMQVVTRVHSDKFEVFGGDHAAFDPISNLRVGAQVLKESIARAGGSLEDGLRTYVGATSISAEGYMRKVMGEREFLARVKRGDRVPLNASVTVSPSEAPRPAKAAPPDDAVRDAALPTLVASDSRPPAPSPGTR